MDGHRTKKSISTAFFIFAMAVVGFAQGQHEPQAPPPPGERQRLANPPPDNPLARAKNLYRAGNLEGAAREYNGLIQAYPESALAYVGLVHVYIRQHRPAEAYAAAAKAFALAPNLDEVRTAMGEVYFRQGKVEEAEKTFIALARANTGDARAYLGMFRLYRAASYFKHAKLVIDHAHQLDPLDPDIAIAWVASLTPERRKGPRADEGHEKNPGADVEATPRGLCRLATRPASMEMRMSPLLISPEHVRGFGLRVGLNGVPATLLLDTGASGLLVDRNVAEKAGILAEDDTMIGGIGDQGASAGFRGYADSIKIGDLEFRDCPVHIIDKKSVLGDEGLIGPDVFSEFLIELNFPDRKFKVTELPQRPIEASAKSESPDIARFHDPYVAPEMSQFTPIYRMGHYLLIPTRVNDLPSKLFLIDTGAFGSIISPDAAKEVTRVSSDSHFTVKGLSGKVDNVFRGNELTLQFSHFKQKNLDIIAFDTSLISDKSGVEVSGILGFSLLGMLRIRIDYRDGLVDFEYDPNRRH